MGSFKKYFCFLLPGIFLFNYVIYAQKSQYRRGTDLQKDYQTYEQKYQGKNLLEEKRRLYPLDKVTSGTGIWTELNPKVPRVDYLGIHFVNTDNGWACGDLGTVIKSTDGGESWITEETNTTTPVLKVNSFDGQMVIAAGFNGMILRSTDGGESWIQVSSGVTGDLWGLQMINDTLGWSCGTANSLIKTTDGGLSWQAVTTPGYSSDYWWIDFLNEDYGFIAANGKVLRTTDGGNSWEIIQAGDTAPLYAIDVIDSLHIAAAGYGGTGYSGKNIYSSNGGNTWINGGQTTTDPINCIKYISPDTGYITMSEVGLWKTTNRGQNWTLLDSIPLTNIGEFEIQLFKQQNVGYDAGSSVKIYKAEGSLDTWHKIIINDDFVDVFFTTEQKGFVISSGPRGRVYRTFDSGEHWELAPGPSGYSLLFTDSLTGYLGSTSVWKTTNGGDSWYQTNSPNTYGEVNKIFFINKQIGWYVAIGGVIYKTTDYGENWFQQLYRSGAGFSSISFADSLYGWASLGGWNPYKTTDGGINWIEQTNINIYNTGDVYFTNQDTGWITGDYTGFILYKTIDAGVTWDTVGGMYQPRRFTFFPDSNHWWTYGFSHIYGTTDDGTTWQEVPPPSLVFGKFSAPLNWLGYGVAGGGYIVKYTDSTFVPVELNSFSANVTDQNVLLNWSTATEANNSGFEVQRLQNYKIAKLQNWKRIGFVRGNGTSTVMHIYSFIDKNVSTGKYYYRLKQIDYDGSYEYSKIVEVVVTVPTEFSLEQNYPNPFNPTTTIKYTIPDVGISFMKFVSLKIYNTLGEEVATLVNEEKPAGSHTVKFDGGNLPSGVYIYRLTAGNYSAVKKLVLLK